MTNRGIGTALAAAVLFGLSTPLSKLLLGQISPAMLAGLLYLGSGLGLSFLLLLRPRPLGLVREQRGWLALAILCGGVLGPLFLMLGLARVPASSASLMLNFEGVFTAGLAWFAFGENFDRRVALGMLAIGAGGMVLAWPSAGFTLPEAALWVLAACFCWALDNNFTQKVSGADSLSVARWKGLAAGVSNLGLAFLGAHWHWPETLAVGAALLVGFLGYGLSLSFFVSSLRLLGTARTGAYFSLAPFVGAGLSLLLFHEPLSWRFGAAAVLMGWGVYLHVTETHDHEHEHEPLEHSHEHVHDEHHQHEHRPEDPAGEPHTHWHRHEPLKHSHPHYPDLHHRHEH